MENLVNAPWSVAVVPSLGLLRVVDAKGLDVCVANRNREDWRRVTANIAAIAELPDLIQQVQQLLTVVGESPEAQKVAKTLESMLAPIADVSELQT